MLGVHPDTLRDWADSGRVESTRVGRERRFRKSDLDAFLGITTPSLHDTRPVALYCRVSGRDQRSSLDAQEAELRASVPGDVVVFSEVGSGLSSKRRRLNKMLDGVAEGRFSEVRVTHEDRLARFGVPFLERFCQSHGTRVVVLHDAAPGSAAEELLGDFMALVASFTGRLYGMRSAEKKRLLLEHAGERVRTGFEVDPA